MALVASPLLFGGHGAEAQYTARATLSEEEKSQKCNANLVPALSYGRGIPRNVRQLVFQAFSCPDFAADACKQKFSTNSATLIYESGNNDRIGFFITALHGFDAHAASGAQEVRLVQRMPGIGRTTILANGKIIAKDLENDLALIRIPLKSIRVSSDQREILFESSLDPTNRLELTNPMRIQFDFPAVDTMVDLDGRFIGYGKEFQSISQLVRQPTDAVDDPIIQLPGENLTSFRGWGFVAKAQFGKINNASIIFRGQSGSLVFDTEANRRGFGAFRRVSSLYDADQISDVIAGDFAVRRRLLVAFDAAVDLILRQRIEASDTSVDEQAEREKIIKRFADSQSVLRTLQSKQDDLSETEVMSLNDALQPILDEAAQGGAAVQEKVFLAALYNAGVGYFSPLIKSKSMFAASDQMPRSTNVHKIVEYIKDTDDWRAWAIDRGSKLFPTEAQEANLICLEPIEAYHLYAKLMEYDGSNYKLFGIQDKMNILDSAVFKDLVPGYFEGEEITPGEDFLIHAVLMLINNGLPYEAAEIYRMGVRQNIVKVALLSPAIDALEHGAKIYQVGLEIEERDLSFEIAADLLLTAINQNYGELDGARVDCPFRQIEAAGALKEYGRALYYQGKTNVRRPWDALPFLAQAAACNVNDAEPYDYIAKTLNDRGELTLAAKALASAHDRAPGPKLLAAWQENLESQAQIGTLTEGEVEAAKIAGIDRFERFNLQDVLKTSDRVR